MIVQSDPGVDRSRSQGLTLDVSVIVPAFNGEATIGRCLEALSRQTVPRERYEVVVVDDGSTDGTCRAVKAHPGVRLLVQAHLGPAAARNLGIEHAGGEIVLFTDADCAPAPDWIERMVAPFEDEQVVGVKGAYRSEQRELVARFVQLEYESKYERMARHMAREGTIDFIDTYAAGYRRDVLRASGGFDTTFPNASVEDQELSFRLAHHGFKMVFVPQALVYHWGHAATVGAYARKKFKIGYWKVAVHRRHPDKLWRDSHTPQALKAQIVLIGLAGLCLAAAIFWPPSLWGAALLGLAFWGTASPLLAKAWPQDRPAAVAALALLPLRALALGLGFASGILAGLPGAKDRPRVD